MRLVIDSMIGLMLVGIVVGVMLYHRQETVALDEVQSVHQSLADLHEAATLHRVLGAEGDARGGYLRIVKPAWFGERMPINVLLGRDHPWIDVAPPGDLAEHPPDPVADSSEQAGFWYNPARGIFRARVLRQVSERDTLALYNRVNSCALRSILPHPDPDPARRPVALAPADATTALASPNRGVIERATQRPAAAPPPPITDVPEDEVVTLDFDQPDPPSLYEPTPPPPKPVAHDQPTPPAQPTERRTLRQP